MIEYVEIRRKSDREFIGIIDNANSIIWHAKYYGVGDFEIYVDASEENVALLVEGNFVTRPDDIEIGVIESVNISDDPNNGLMITAAGRFAKSILDRRHIYRLSGTVNSPTILRGNVETAVRNVVSNNAISCVFDYRRNISFLELGASSSIPAIIVDENGDASSKQVSYVNLLTYTDSVLEEYGIGATLILNVDNGKLQYVCYVGSDRSVNNTAGNDPIIFSSDYDNMTDSAYSYDETNFKNAILIGGEGEGLARFYVVIKGSKEGIDRRETWLDASSVSKKYKDDNDEEQEYTAAEYEKLLKTEGKQALTEYQTVESFGGTLDVTGGVWKLNEDYYLGDIVTIQNNRIGKFADVRITEITEVQDENGYSVDITYSK